MSQPSDPNKTVLTGFDPNRTVIGTGPVDNRTQAMVSAPTAGDPNRTTAWAPASLIFGLALVLVMLFRPAGLLPSAVRKRELSHDRTS